jgi:WD40 repeat protein
MAVALVALPAACTSHSLAVGDQAAPPPQVPAPDSAPPDPVPPDAGDDGPHFSANTTWAACGADLGQPESITALAVSPNGHYLAAGSYQSTLWDLRQRGVLRTIETDGGIKPAFSPDSTLLALAGDGRFVYRLPAGDGSLVATYSSSIECLAWSSTLAFTADNTHVALGACAGVELRPLLGDGVVRLPSHVWSPGVAFSPDGRWLATSGPELWRADGSQRMWPADVIAGPRADGFSDAFNWLMDNTVSFSPDGALLLVSNTIAKPQVPDPDWTATTQLLRASDGSLVRDFGGTLGRHPSFSPDGAWIAAGGTLVHLASGAMTTFAPHIAVSVFLPDGRIAAADNQRVVRIYCPR